MSQENDQDGDRQGSPKGEDDDGLSSAERLRMRRMWAQLIKDDLAIPDVGGWSQVFLDLTRYAGHDQVQIRFRFQSDASDVQAGSYIDDLHIYGRPVGYQRSPRRAGGRLLPD
jgi:hypothetical protein